jgi:phosphoheptose isomerase
MSDRTRAASKYPEHYLAELRTAVAAIDPGEVSQVIDLFREARLRSRRIFVCGDSRSAAVASHFLCEMVKESGFGRSSQFRTVALTDDPPNFRGIDGDLDSGSVFANQLRSLAEPGDVVVGLSCSGNSANVLRAMEYAREAGCRTISMTGGAGGKLVSLGDVSVLIRATHPGSVEDALIAVCHMIGSYFAGMDFS